MTRLAQRCRGNGSLSTIARESKVASGCKRIGSRIADLSPARKQLLAIFQDISFGRLESLFIRNGDPVLDPKPRRVRQVKFGCDCVPVTAELPQDYLLKRQVVELLNILDTMQHGVIDVLEIQNGLPFRMTITEDHIR